MTYSPTANMAAAINYLNAQYRIEDGLTPQQRAAQHVERELREDEDAAHRLNQAITQHLTAMDRTTPLGQAVLELHRPDYPEYGRSDVSCLGCDQGDYAETDPEWPCTTYELVRDWTEG